MYTIYISKYEKDGVLIDTPLCIYDKRSPAEDMMCLDPVCNLVDSRAGDLSITMPLGHYAYDYIRKGVTIISMYRLDVQSTDPLELKETLIFEGPIRRQNKNFGKDKILYAEGFFSYLNESVQPEKQYFDTTLEEFLRGVIAVHNEKMTANGDIYKCFELGTVEIDYPDTDYSGNKVNNHKSEFESTQFGTSMEYFLAIQNSYGGHFIFSKNDGVYHIDYVRHLPKNTNQVICFGENLLDFTTNDDTSDICSCVVPISGMNSSSLSKIGKTAASSQDAVDDALKIYAGETPEKWVKGTDDHNRVCMVLYETPKDPLTPVKAYCYLSSGITRDNSFQLGGYFLRRQVDGDAGSPPDVAGAYHITPNPFGNQRFYDDNRVIRYFPDPKGEVVYLTGRPLNIGNERVDPETGSWKYDYSGMYTSSMYRDGVNILQYQSAEDSLGFNSVQEVKLDMTYTPDGEDMYVNHFNVSGGHVTPLGGIYVSSEILVAGNGKELPAEVKHAKYAHSKNPEVGEQITKIADYEGDTGILVYRGNTLAKDLNDSRPWFYSVISMGLDTDVYILDLGDYLTNEDNPFYGTDGILVSTRTLGYTDGTYVADALLAMYSPDPAWWGGRQINFVKLENQGFTSEIYYLIDFSDPANKGTQLIKVSSWGESMGQNGYDISNAPVKFYKYNKHVNKLANYLTADGADADDYHEEGSIYVKDQNLIAKYGYKERRLEFNGIEDSNVLVKRGEAYLIDNQFGKMSMDLKGLNLHDLNINVDSLDISTQIQVLSHPHNLDQFFEIESLAISPDDPRYNEVSLSESEEGSYSGKLPVSVLTATDELREVIFYGTSTEYTGDVTITITNLSTEDVFTHVESVVKLSESNPASVGDITSFNSGLVEITADVDIPLIKFKYDKVRDGQ